MKKRVCLFMFMFLICFLLVGCSDDPLISFITTTKESESNTTVTTEGTNSSDTSSTNTNTDNPTTDKTTTATTVTTPTTVTTTVDTSSYTNYYKETSLNYTYYDLGQEGYYNWFYMNALGNQKILVIPVTISGYATTANEVTRNDINSCFFGTEENTYWESVKSYYYESSYGQLNITGTVTSWMSNSSFTVKNLKNDVNVITNYTSTFLANQGINAKDYDSDNDGYIDLVWYIYSAPDYDNAPYGTNIPDNFWAYTYSTELDPDTSNPVVNNFCWASYDFMYEASSSRVGSPDAHTYIHETGHALGLDDYYNADQGVEDGDPVGYADMMSENVIDHNSFSKIAYGWLKPYVVYGNAEITLTPLSESASAVVLGLNWDHNAFSEYLIFEFYTPTGLNKQDALTSYSGNYSNLNFKGVRIYHVDARLASYKNSTDYTILSKLSDLTTGQLIAFTVHSNTPSYSIVYGEKGYGKESDIPIITLVDKSGYSHLTNDYYMDEDSLYVSGDTFDASTVKLNGGGTLNYTVSFSNMTDEGITLTFTKK